MGLPDIDTPAGTLRLVAGPGRKSVWLAVLETDAGLIFPATAVAVPSDVPGIAWLRQVARRISATCRETTAAEVAREVAPRFVAYVRSLGDEAAWHFTNDDPDDMDEARASVERGLAAALRFDDPYQATKAFERDVYFGQADIRLVDMFRAPQMLERVAELASAPDAFVASARKLEDENLGRSQMVRAMANSLRGERDGAPAPFPG